MTSTFAAKTVKFVVPGPGGVELKLSPGTEALQMSFHIGHWYLPINKKFENKYLLLREPKRSVFVGDKPVFMDDSKRRRTLSSDSSLF